MQSDACHLHGFGFPFKIFNSCVKLKRLFYYCHWGSELKKEKAVVYLYRWSILLHLHKLIRNRSTGALNSCVCLYSRQKERNNGINRWYYTYLQRYNQNSLEYIVTANRPALVYSIVARGTARSHKTIETLY